jgi:hypothetical protein
VDPPKPALAARLLTAAWTAMGLVLWLLFPMTAAGLLPLCAIAPLAWHWAVRGRLPWYWPSAVTGVLLLAAAYLLMNASWSRSPQAAASAVVLAVLAVGVLHIVLNTLPDLEPAPLRAMAVGALAGLAVGGLLICLEVFSDQSLRRALIRLVPALQPSPSHVVGMAGGHLTQLAPYLPNANVSVLAAMLWPAALLVRRLGLWRVPFCRYAALAAAGGAAAAVLASEHATSQVALAGASATFAVYRLRPRLGMSLLVAGWVAASLLVVPTVSALYGAGAYRTTWLPESARHRVVIWGHTAGRVADAPLLGAGIGTARALSEAEDAAAPSAPGSSFRLSTSLHSHNAYLQVWFETGAVGALILLGLGLLVLRTLARFAGDIQPYMAATFAACALLVASAYSIWAPWFMASLAMAAMFAALGAALPEGERRPGVD